MTPEPSKHAPLQPRTQHPTGFTSSHDDSNGTQVRAKNRGPLHLCLVHHGATEWALSGRHLGRTDVSLTAHGEDEARQLGLLLCDSLFTHVLSSPRKRALRTCELVSLRMPVQVEADLAEWDYGDYEGLRSTDIQQQRPGWNLYRDGCPHGETPEQVAERADRLITRLRTLEGNVALFSHGQFGALLAARWIGLPVVSAQHFALGTASLSVFGYDPHHLEVPVIALGNVASDDDTRALLASPPQSHASHVMTIKRRAVERWENEGGRDPRLESTRTP